MGVVVDPAELLTHGGDLSVVGVGAQVSAPRRVRQVANAPLEVVLEDAEQGECGEREAH